MLKLRREGCTGHSSGVNKTGAKVPDGKGQQIVSSVKAKCDTHREEEAMGQTGPTHTGPGLQVKSFKAARASLTPNSAKTPPTLSLFHPTRGQESRKYKKYPRLWVIQGALWERRTHLPMPNAGDTGDMGSFPRSGRFPGEGNSNPPQYS